MAKDDLLKMPDDLEGNLRALLQTPPAPHDTTGSRKAAPKAPKKPRQRRPPKPPKMRGKYVYEIARVLKKGKRGPRKKR